MTQHVQHKPKNDAHNTQCSWLEVKLMTCLTLSVSKWTKTKRKHIFSNTKRHQKCQKAQTDQQPNLRLISRNFQEKKQQQTSLKIEKKGILKHIEALFSLNKQPFFPLKRTNWCRLHELNQSFSFLVGDYFLNTLSFCKKENTKTQQVCKKKFDFSCKLTWRVHLFGCRTGRDLQETLVDKSFLNRVTDQLEAAKKNHFQDVRCVRCWQVHPEKTCSMTSELQIMIY